MQAQPTSNTDEITLRDLILRMQAFAAEIRKRWIIVVLSCLPFLGWFGYKAFTKPITYTAKLTFMLNDDKGGTGIASILGSFGGLLDGGSDYQLEKILEIARSRRIISSAMFDSLDLNGVNDLFANHVIRTQQLHRRWRSDKMLNGFLFTRNNPVQFNRQENKALLALYGEMIGGRGVTMPMLGTGLNDDTGIMTLSIRSRDEMLSIELLNTLYQKLSAFYIEKSIQREQETLNILAQKRDSIGNALDRNDRQSAQFDQQYRNLVMETQKVPGVQNRRSNQLLTLMYGEAIKNAELAEFALKSKMPFLTMIDVPIPPIRQDSRGRAIAILSALIAGCICGVIYIFISRFYRMAMSDSNGKM